MHADVRVLFQAVITVGGVETAPVRKRAGTAPRSAWFVAGTEGARRTISSDPTVRGRARADRSRRGDERIAVASSPTAAVDGRTRPGTFAADLAGMSETKAGAGRANSVLCLAMNHSYAMA